ncbi:MAG: ABC transporter substrate-binding protein [Sphingomicrobium sp.]
MRVPPVFLALLVLTGFGTAACQRRDESAIKVAVIGATPRLADPSALPISSADAILLTNAAQGLVRFDANGQIEPGLAERWNVSDDGLSYVFRIAATNWPDGAKVTAQQITKILRRALGRTSRNPMRDTLGAVTEIVPMTDRVIEIRLAAPRPNLLQLLAQPEMAIMRPSGGTGPFMLKRKRAPDGALRLKREILETDGEHAREEELWLTATAAAPAIKQFNDGKLDLVLGGTFADLPFARRQRLARNVLHFDPVAGLFGLIPLQNYGPFGLPEARALLSQVIDRESLINGFDVPGLSPRATLLQGGLEGLTDPPPPPWMATPIADRRATLLAESDRLFGVDEKPTARIDLPEGPGADRLLQQLQRDWGLLGITVERSGPGRPADFKLVDEVAPSVSPAWFLRHFRCQLVSVCLEEADKLMDAARAAPVAQQRAALFTEAARMMDEDVLFIPIAAPVRWSLVSNRVKGFAGNRFARHTLTGLQQPPGSD